MRYFVTGASGFIGGRVARKLRERGHEVVAFLRDPTSTPELATLGVRLHAGDLESRESLRSGMRGADGVFHLAAWYKVGVKDTGQADRTNVDGTRNVLEVMQELGIARGVYTSTLAINSGTGGLVVDESYRFSGRHVSRYDETKARAHYEVALPMMHGGLPLIIVQPGVNYGPGDTSFVRKVLVRWLTGKLSVIPRESAYCWAHVDDTAEGHILAMEKGRIGESYILAGPAHTLVEVFTTMSAIAGIPAPRAVSPRLIRALASVMSVIAPIIPLPEDAQPETLRVMGGLTYLGASAKAERELGFHVRSIEEGMRETIAHEAKLLGLTLPRRLAGV